MSVFRGKVLVQMVLNLDANKNRVLASSDNLSIDQCSNSEDKENASIVFESEVSIPKISWDLTELTPVQNVVIEGVAISVSSETVINFNTSSQDFFNNEPNEIFCKVYAEKLSTGSSDGSNIEPTSNKLGCSDCESSNSNGTGEDLAEYQNERIRTSENAPSNIELCV